MRNQHRQCSCLFHFTIEDLRRCGHYDIPSCLWMNLLRNSICYIRGKLYSFWPSQSLADEAMVLECVTRIFRWAPRAGWSSWGHQPSPHHLEGLGTAVSSPIGGSVRSPDPPPPKRFPLFSTLRMASPDTRTLLIVEYHAAVGGGKNHMPLAYATGVVVLCFIDPEPVIVGGGPDVSRNAPLAL